MYSEQDYLLDKLRYSERIYRFLEVIKRTSMPSAYELSTNQMYAYMYANIVLEGPFPEGEHAIAQASDRAYFYARDVLKRPWPQGEPVIAEDPFWAYQYARYVLRGPFPEGEPAMARDLVFIVSYLACFPERKEVVCV